MEPTPKTCDGKWIVLKNGQRTGVVYENQADAQAAANDMRKLCESQGDTTVVIEAKQLIMG